GGGGGGGRGGGVGGSRGTGALWGGGGARSASPRPWTALTRSGLVGLRLDPEDEAALYGNGLVAEGRPQKYLGSSKGWPMRAEPTSLPSFEMRLPWAWYGKTACATPVTRSGYATPVTRVRAARMTRAGRSCASMVSTPSYTRPSATRIMSTSLIPGNGMRMPPTPRTRGWRGGRPAPRWGRSGARGGGSGWGGR